MRKVTLNEVMGKGAGESTKLTMDELPSILGESMPELPKNNIGRFRLIRALQQRFGKNFRTLPGVNDLVKEFDSQCDYETRIAKLKSIKVDRSKK